MQKKKILLSVPTADACNNQLYFMSEMTWKLMTTYL